MMVYIVLLKMGIWFSVNKKMFLYDKGTLEQENMTSSLMRESTVVQVVGLHSTSLRQNSIPAVAGQPSMMVFLVQ
jgi:hypothetical protein